MSRIAFETERCRCTRKENLADEYLGFSELRKCYRIISAYPIIIAFTIRIQAAVCLGQFVGWSAVALAVVEAERHGLAHATHVEFGRAVEPHERL